jgi:cytochrome c oxidase subunit II
MIIAGVLILILAIVTVVGAVTAFQLPEAITEQGKKTVPLYQATLAVSFLVFFGVTAALIYAVFKFRRTGPEMPVQVHGSSTLEFTWTVIPVIILIALFIPSLILVIDFKTPPAEADADVVIGVVGHQWWWEFQYPDNVKVQATPPNYEDLTPPTMVVPVNKTILLNLRSTDVIHSFYAPHMLYKIQTIPGNVNKMHFKAEKTGTFSGQCYQFCGTRHADMRWTLQVVSESEYQQWLRDQRSAAQATPVAR